MSLQQFNDMLIVAGDYPSCLKSVSLKLLLVLCTATDTISHNTLLEYLTITCTFHPVMQVPFWLSSLSNHYTCDTIRNLVMICKF